MYDINGIHVSEWVDYANPIASYRNDSLNILIDEFDDRDIMHTWSDEAYQDEYATFDTVNNFMRLNHSYNPEKQTCYVFNLEAVIDGSAILNKDFFIKDTDNALLFVQCEQLQPGDWITTSYGRTKIGVTDRRLNLKTQGYYSYNIVDGQRYHLWVHNKEKYAEYNSFSNRWLWKS
jgi:hypothetical protein